MTHRSNALHVAIIMDGNGRWASARGLPRSAGHRQGAEAVRQVVEAAPALGVHTLTLFAFSSDNWSRPPREVGALMRLFRAYLRSESARLAERGVRLSVIGRRDRLALPLRVEIERAERRTAAGSVLHLRLAIDYSARDALVRAASQCTTPAPPTGRSRAREPLTRDGFARHLAEA
jgi:undecaprenyl diphosphate synthase